MKTYLGLNFRATSSTPSLGLYVSLVAVPLIGTMLAAMFTVQMNWV
jgi:hypothetical protein